MVESLTYKYINGNLAQEYAANWKVESQNLPPGSTLETSEVPSQLTITVPANNTSSTRSGKIVLLQPASGKRILKGSEIKAGSTFYFQCRFYAINGWEGQLVKAIIIAITQNISEMVYATEYLCQGYQQVI